MNNSFKKDNISRQQRVLPKDESALWLITGIFLPYLFFFYAEHKHIYNGRNIKNLNKLKSIYIRLS